MNARLFFFLILLGPAIRGGAFPGATDSLLHWLEVGDQAAWLRAREEIAREGADEALGRAPLMVQWAFQLPGDRPEWMPDADDGVWQWYTAALPALQSQWGNWKQAAFEVDPGPTAEWLAEREAIPSFPWPRVWGAATGLLAAVAGGLWGTRRRMLQPVKGQWAQLHHDLRKGHHSSATIELWKGFTAKQIRLEPEGAAWQLLSAPEREVAALLAQNLSVRNIAHRMACSTNYIYNLRSAIRQKWNLTAKDDLISVIQQVLKQNL